MRPFFQRENWLIYPIYGGLGASFGYWLQGVEDNQMRYLKEARDRLLERRKRRAEREGALAAGPDQHQAPIDSIGDPSEPVTEKKAVA